MHWHGPEMRLSDLKPRHVSNVSTLSVVPVPFQFAMVIALGLIFGSFVTALSYRLPRGQNIATDRSRCVSCGHPLTVRDLVPVISWAMHRGACRHCGARVSWRYPAIELLVVSLFAVSYMLMPDLRHFALLSAISVVAVALAVIDIEQGSLPNVLVAIFAVLAVAWQLVERGDLVVSLGVAAGTFVVLFLAGTAYRARFGGIGLGLGDTKLMAAGALALPLGPLLLFLTLLGLLGVVFGLIWRGMTGKPEFPFGPAILASFWVSMVAGGPILDALVDLPLG
jgi:leader peptidase (prepilin peptidase)/N-methyltransferase